MMSSSASEGDQRGPPRRRLDDEGNNVQNQINIDSDGSGSDDVDDEDQEYHHPGDLELGDLRLG